MQSGRQNTMGWERRDQIGTALLSAVVIAAGVVVDPAALAAFDAPKRCACLLGCFLAVSWWVATTPSQVMRRPAWTRGQWGCVVGVLVALLAACTASWLAPHSGAAGEALRAVLSFGLLLPLGAASTLSAGRGRVIAGVFLAVAGVNAGLCIGERWLEVRPFAIATFAGRAPVLGLIGNEGSLGIALAMAAVLALFGYLTEARRAGRWSCAAVLLLNLGGVMATAGVTSLLSLFAGFAALAVLHFGRRGFRLAAVAGLLLVVAAVAVPAIRGRVIDLHQAVRSGDADRLTTYRLGAWAAALEMARARPLLGYGPGNFAAQFVTARLLAEERYGRRFVVPGLTSMFAQAHNEPLQLLAETGAMGLVGVILAMSCLLGGLAVVARAKPARPCGQEATVLLAVLTTGAIASLTWFPWQMPLSGVVLLLACGRGFRLLGRDESTVAPTVAVPLLARAIVIIAWITAGGFSLAWPEVQRWQAERLLGRADAGLREQLRRREVGPRPEDLTGIAALAMRAASHLSGDSRPLLVAGSAMLAAGRTAEALHHYCSALALGERPEIDLNIGRAHAVLDQRPQAFAAFLRAAWLSPALLPSMPTAAQPLVEEQIEERTRYLAKSQPNAVPPALADLCR